MPPYLVGERGLDLLSMGMLTSIPALTDAIGIIIGGKLVQSYLSGKEKYLAIVRSILVILLLYLIFNAPSVTLVITFQSLCTIFHGLVFALPHKIFSKNNIGLAIGFINLGGMMAHS